ncbi:MAG: hypothetical protein WCS65_00490 [Verrucomicrobiae bacterium]
MLHEFRVNANIGTRLPLALFQIPFSLLGIIGAFQGAEDMFAPPKFSDYLAKTARDVRINSIAGQGHFYHLAYGCQTLKKVKDLFYADAGQRGQSAP